MATFAQVSAGILYVQKDFIQTWFVWWNRIPVFLGGYAISFLLIVNLAAGYLRYRYRGGILLIHVGLGVLIIGEFLTGILSQESQMAISIDEVKNYAEVPHDVELAIIETTQDDFDQVVAIRPHEAKSYEIPELPFKVRLKTFYANSKLVREQGKIRVYPLPVSKRDTDVNVVSADVEIEGVGTYLMTSAASLPQSFSVDDRTFEIVMRRRRIYFPFSLKMTQFEHEMYPGTNIPSKFLSRLKVYGSLGDYEREASVTMNHPLRYQGRTFYQSSYGENDTLSVLQVVKNPVYWTPYFSSMIVSIGLLLQFIQGYRRSR